MRAGATYPTLVLAAEQTIAIASVVRGRRSTRRQRAAPTSTLWRSTTTRPAFSRSTVNATATIAVTSQNLTTALAAIDCVACNAVSNSPGRLRICLRFKRYRVRRGAHVNPPTWATPWVDQVVDNTFVDPSGLASWRRLAEIGACTTATAPPSFSPLATAHQRTRERSTRLAPRGASRYAHWTALCSKPFTTADGTFVWLRKVSGTSRAYNQPGVILVTLTDSYTATDPLVPVGHACIGDVQFDSYAAPGVHYAYNVRTDVVSGVAHTPQLTRTGSTTTTIWLSMLWRRDGLALAACNQYVESQGTTNLCGSVLASYDGTVSHEHRVSEPPVDARAIVGAGGSGNIEGDASNYRYSYVAVYVWDDERGNRWFRRSATRTRSQSTQQHNNCNCVLYVVNAAHVETPTRAAPKAEDIPLPYAEEREHLLRWRGDRRLDLACNLVHRQPIRRLGLRRGRRLHDGRRARIVGPALVAIRPLTRRTPLVYQRRRRSNRLGPRVMVAGEAPAWSPLLTLQSGRRRQARSRWRALTKSSRHLLQRPDLSGRRCRANDAGAGEPMPTPQLSARRRLYRASQRRLDRRWRVVFVALRSVSADAQA